MSALFPVYVHSERSVEMGRQTLWLYSQWSYYRSLKSSSNRLKPLNPNWALFTSWLLHVVFVMLQKPQWHNRPTWLEYGPGDFSSSWPLFWGWGQDVNAVNLPTLVNLVESSLRPDTSHIITSHQWKDADLQGGCGTGSSFCLDEC